jgi:endoglucanase
MKNIKPDFDLLKRLSETPGVSGHEDRVAELIQSELPREHFNVHKDNLGNLIAHKSGKGKKIMIVAHMDEVGLIIQRILPNGFLKVERIGGTSLRALPGSRLSLWSSEGCIPAAAGVLPQHLDPKEPITDFSKVYIDVGANSIEEIQSLGILPGDVLTWDSSFQSIEKNLLRGKALDDRLGCYMLIQLANLLAAQETKHDLYLVFSVQEESMLSGGVTAANAISPDMLIGVDGTLAFDTPDLEGQQCDMRLGNGPALKWMDAIRGKMAAFFPDQEFAKSVRKTANDNNIPLQDEIVTGMSTAITPMVYASKGASAIGLSVPIRYHHTPIETADKRDIENLILLLNLLLTKYI